MKAKKKTTGIKQKIREEKKREQRRALALAAAVLITIISVSGFLVNSMLNQPSNQTINQVSEPKAAIVDHLSLTSPNQTFIAAATNILKQAGYAVDYYSGEKVTVDFYRNLPCCGYKIIVLRVHSGHNPERQMIGFFTSEVYSQSKYVNEQLTDRLERVAFGNPPSEGELTYFAINHLFVKYSMKEKFNNTFIMMMGCYGLEYPSMAEALIEKGAKVYISWNGSVLASHTDQATTHLLQHLITEKQTIKNAITQTIREVGTDPAYNSRLIYYPLEAGNQTAKS